MHRLIEQLLRWIPIMPLPHNDIAGVILVGGKSRRMGRDKAFVTVGGQPLFERVLKVFQDAFITVILAGDREERFSSYGIPVVPDIYPGSALGGVYSGLLHAPTQYVFISSCDMPFPSGDIVAYLCSLRQGFDAVVPTMPHGYEPLFALYSKTCLNSIQRYLESGNYCAFGYYPDIRIREVPLSDLAHIDAAERCFLNINTPEEMLLLEKEIASANESRVT